MFFKILNTIIFYNLWSYVDFNIKKKIIINSLQAYQIKNILIIH